MIEQRDLLQEEKLAKKNTTRNALIRGVEIKPNGRLTPLENFIKIVPQEVFSILSHLYVLMRVLFKEQNKIQWEFTNSLQLWHSDSLMS